MMGCPSDLLLELMLDQVLDADKQDLLEQHVEHCLPCIYRLERLVRVSELPPDWLLIHQGSLLSDLGNDAGDESCD